MSTTHDHENLTPLDPSESTGQEALFDVPDENSLANEAQGGEAQIPDVSPVEQPTELQHTAYNKSMPGSPSSEPETQATHTDRSSRWSSRRWIAVGTAGTVLVAGVAVGVMKALSGESSPRTGTTLSQESASPSAQSGAGATPPNPTPTDIPSTTTETTPTNTETPDSGTELGNLNPTKPLAVPYVEGQSITKPDVKALIHNLEVAVNTGDTQNLLYSGIYPDSEIADGVTEDIRSVQSEKQQMGTTLVGTYHIKINDNDILFDPSDPTTVHVLEAVGTDFDFKYTSASKPLVSYWEKTLHLNHEVIPLPSGQVKDILVTGNIDSSQSTGAAWTKGYTSSN